MADVEEFSLRIEVEGGVVFTDFFKGFLWDSVPLTDGLCIFSKVGKDIFSFEGFFGFAGNV